MRIETNTEIIARGGRVGQVANSIASIIVLGGLLLSFTAWKAITVILIALGVVMYTVGSRQISQAAREPRFVQQLEDALSGFDDRYRLYNHILPADHVLLTPNGLFVLIVRGVDGRVRCFRDKWVRDLSLGRLLRFFTEESLGNPTKDAQKQVDRLQKYVEERKPEAAVDVQAVAVFVNPKVRLEVTGASLPVLPLRTLRMHLRKVSQQREIPPETLAALTELFDEAPKI
jgi:hypothetical protein